MDKKTLKEIINADLFRYYGEKSFKIFLKAYRNQPGFKYSYFLRKSTYYLEKKSKFRYYYFYWRLRKITFKFGFDISPECKIGKGLYLGHFGKIGVHPKTEIGCNVNLAPGVAIGQTNRGKNKGVPKIGNNVWIGTNSIIVGNIKIGDNALIAPVAYVNFDVPENAVVMGSPGKIVSYEGSTGYINHKVLY